MLARYRKVIPVVIAFIAITVYVLPLDSIIAQNAGGPPEEREPREGREPRDGRNPYVDRGRGPPPGVGQGQGQGPPEGIPPGRGPPETVPPERESIPTTLRTVLASPATPTSALNLITLDPTITINQLSLIQYCQSTGLCPNIKVIQKPILDRPFARLPSPEFIQVLREDLVPTTDINALAATIPTQYPGAEVLNVIDTPGYKAITVRGVDINNLRSDPKFTVTEQQTYFGHIAQVGQDPAPPIIWDQTLPSGVQRTLPISLNATTTATTTTSPTPPTPRTATEIPATSNAQSSAAGSSTEISSTGRKLDIVATQGPAASEQIASESGLNDFDNVDIAVLDTGVSLTHPDLNVYRNVGLVDGASSGDDDNGHGSIVAGIAAAKDNSIGVRGIAPDARLWAIKVCDKLGECKVSDQMKGIEYAIKHADEIDVLNISIENPNTPALNSIIDEAVRAGITVVAAAGNSGSSASSISPANDPNVITVSAIGDSDGKCGGLGPAMEQFDGKVTDDTFAYFSNTGPEVKIAAPGVNILSTSNGTGYALDSGTSMAAPHVAGAAALYVAQHPNAPPAQVMAELIASGTTSNTQCNGGPRGYFVGDNDGVNEPLLFAASLPSQG